MKFIIPPLVKSVLFLCLACFLAVPVQSQTATPAPTPSPTPPARLMNPTVMAPCGLPASYAEFTSAATVTTFNMTANCTINDWDVGNNTAFLYFSSGEFTINGNGHSIIGPSNRWTIYVQNAGTVLNLNNVTIRENDFISTVVNGARLNARSVIFRDNNPTIAGSTVLHILLSGRAHFEDVQFLSNSASDNAIVLVNGSGILGITNGIFRTNRNDDGVIVKVDQNSSFSGSGIIFEDNSAGTVLWVSGPGALTSRSRATLQNTQFLNNRQIRLDDPSNPLWNSASQAYGSAVTAYYGTVTLTNGVFRANRNVAGRTNVIVALYTWSAVSPYDVSIINLEGCMTFENNVQSDGITAASDYALYPFSTGYLGNRGDSRITRSGRCGGKRPRPEKTRPTPTATPRPAYAASYIALQTATGMTFEATYGLDSGVHFRQLDGAGIGIQSIIDAGYLAALDVYGYVEQGVEVCFPQAGRVIFLDARTMPRAIVPLESTVVNGQTCVSIDSPGSLVLLPN